MEVYGIMYYKNGNKYEGEFNNDKMEKNGNIYEGEFKDNKFNGNSIINYNNGGKYIEHFVDDHIEGKGLMVFNGGKKQYIGEFKKGNFEGKGVYIYSGGLNYDGEFHNYLKEGKENYFIKMEIYLKENLKKIKRMVLEFYFVDGDTKLCGQYKYDKKIWKFELYLFE